VVAKLVQNESNAASVEITWTTVDETDVSTILIERSPDGFAFEKVLQLKPENDSVNTYTRTDNSPLKGRSYYRLSYRGADKSETQSFLIPIENYGIQAAGIIIEEDEIHADKIEITLQSMNNQDVVVYLRNAEGVEYFIDTFIGLRS